MKKHSVTFTFKSKFDKDYFLGQLSDGFGENYVELSKDINGTVRLTMQDDEEGPYRHAKGQAARTAARLKGTK